MLSMNRQVRNLEYGIPPTAMLREQVDRHHFTPVARQEILANSFRNTAKLITVTKVLSHIVFGCHRRQIVPAVQLFLNNCLHQVTKSAFYSNCKMHNFH